jgi:hypothetical protein
MDFAGSTKILMIGTFESQDGYFVTLGGNYEYLQVNHQLNYGYCIFTASGSLTVVRKRPIENCSILIVGGGGSGGGNNQSSSGGGGGAGGGVTLVNNVNLLPKTTYSITVGAGGARSTVAGNKGGSSSWNNQHFAEGGNGGGAGFITGIYAGNQFPGSGGVRVSGGGAGGAGGYYAPGDIFFPSPGINGGFGQTGTLTANMTHPAQGVVDQQVQRVLGYFGTGGGGGEFQTRWDGGIGYAGGTTPWFVDPRYFLSYSGPYLGAGIGKLLTTPEGDSSYNNYSAYESVFWPEFFGTQEKRIFVGGNGGSGARGLYQNSGNSNAGQNGIVILRYRL